MPQPQPPEDPPWTGADVLRLVVIAAVSLLFLNLAAAFVLHWLKLPFREFAENARVLVPVQLVLYVIVLAFMYSVVVPASGTFWRGLSWRWPALPFAYVLIGTALAFGVALSSAFLPFPKTMPFERLFRDLASVYLIAATAVTIAPLVEELFFRAFLYPVLARRFGLGPGVLLTSAAFALLHSAQYGYGWAPLLLLFIVGLALTFVRATTGSVAAAFLIHVGYNATLFAMLYLGTGGFRHLPRMA